MKYNGKLNLDLFPTYRKVSSRGVTDAIPSEVILKSIDLILQEQINKGTIYIINNVIEQSNPVDSSG